ncbi:hypothetical protein F4778DRAFT_720999 [Xylariomycetidae sp. FL2044]|nr:hypothetical protein F4778DRAFT_720999 [Xylariomycetidae sp. FL2044]
MATANRLKSLLAMPASLRPILLSAHLRSRPTQTLSFSTNLRNLAALRYHDVAALQIPEFRTSPISELPPAELFKSPSLPSAPNDSFEDGLTKLFTRNPAAFGYAESDFYKLRKNTRVPEVCILGRSNVGKSSFVNAIANRQSNTLAHVSSKAGKTRSINTYGFGPAPLIKDIAAQAAEYKGKEDIPTHAFYLVDMPGYGYASQQEWGRNISLYMSKRNNVKGAIVLIDAEVGPKDSDFHLLELLSTAGLRTALVLTKADKVKSGIDGLRKTCTKLWDGICDLENRLTENTWTWEKEIYVTALGAKEHAVTSATVNVARLAVARLAGIVKDSGPKLEKNQRWSGKIVSFDDLQYTAGQTVATTQEGVQSSKFQSSPNVQQKGVPTPSIARSIAVGRTSKKQFTYARAFHTSRNSLRAQNAWRVPRRDSSRDPAPSGLQKPKKKKTDQEVYGILYDFMTALKSKNAPKDAIDRRNLQRERRPPPPIPSPEQRRAQQSARVQQKFPTEAARAKAVHKGRLTREEERQAAKEAALLDDSWPAAETPQRGRKTKGSVVNEPMGVDDFRNAFQGSGGLGKEEVEEEEEEALFETPNKKSKKSKKSGKETQEKKGKKKGAQVEKQDPFDAKFGKLMDTAKADGRRTRATF